MESVIRLAVQKSGRLSDKTLKLIEECGILFRDSRGSQHLKSRSLNFPLELLFLRDDDIPGYVADGVADLGVVGENVLLEKGYQVSIAQRLGFSKCRLAIAVPKGSKFTSVKDLKGCHIATSYPKILNDFLERENISANIHEISGSVEIAPGIGLADAICDIVSSGSTLISNGLKEIYTVLESEAVLIAQPGLASELSAILEKLLFRIKAVQDAKSNKYILLNAPNESIEEIARLLPGIKSPTVVPLADEGWSSVQSVVEESAFWEQIENLKAAGAEGILVVPIEKMIR